MLSYILKDCINFRNNMMQLGAFGPTNKMKGKQVVTFDPADDDSSQSPLPRNKLSYASEGTSEGLEGDRFGIYPRSLKVSSTYTDTHMCIVYILFVSMFINDYYTIGYIDHFI